MKTTSSTAISPPGYQIKRISLMVFCALSIIVFIIYAALSSKIIGEVDKQIDKELAKNDNLKNQDHKEVKKTVSNVALGILIAVFVINILIQLFGFIGAWREHYCLAVTYATLQTLGLIGTFVQSFGRAAMWGSFVIQLIVTIIAILFVLDLSKIRNSRNVQNC